MSCYPDFEEKEIRAGVLRAPDVEAISQDTHHLCLYVDAEMITLLKQQCATIKTLNS
ncbi:hypothetical protein [Aliikangiella sp. IMCC44359]|uniref:hypothetical protein n=1 Tax=Aliikangiella sp. IMCC44359 TaxID=3459125 RepID=UPI00403AE8E5